MLYLLESVDYYKIGFTADEETLVKRLQHYRTHNPDFSLVDLYVGGQKEEKLLHLKCKDYLHQGEWFKKDDVVLDTINTYEKLPKDIVERHILEIVGNFKYNLIGNEEDMWRELYAYRTIHLGNYTITFAIFDAESFLVMITNTTTLEKKKLYFYEQSIKEYFCNYSEKTNNRQFSGILFNSGYILLSVRDRNIKCFEELIYPDVKEIYNCFTREDFKLIEI